ncbi:YbaK/EbsC family protein [Calidithermus roseus]|uniref:Cys-tRNA(Pro)/Cys-tRNA(Cys) deacylase YbaK n=1 Tax=Calidithermus roseus TaxID=1644118 RepID=A0A399F115_9DEIN|nr:YbaK/EbsC family protein [Calidithermus roseus]RIH89670.1 Cys-tRNA(Pro)/Cys-tRNA(Cys) deacylase YbaK [Calidithermus roseus]
MLSSSAQKVQDALHERGFGELRVVEMPASTRTAQEAAEAVGCSVGQIVKSLIFRGAESGRPYLLLVSGSNRVDEARVGERLGERLERARPEWVREVTGFAIGGVPPVGHATPLEALIDPDLLQYEQVWAAAGTPNAVFALSPQQLVALTGGRVMAVN